VSHLRLPAIAAVVGGLLAPALAQNQPQEIREQLIAADRSIWQAIAGPHPNIAQVRNALAADYIDMELGVSHSREDVLKDLQSVTGFSFQYEHPRAFVLSPTSGYVIAELTYSSTSDGKTAGGRILTTTVYSKEHGRWIAHLHTEMDMPAAAGPAPR